jgi:hypothetical protein
MYRAKRHQKSSPNPKKWAFKKMNALHLHEIVQIVNGPWSDFYRRLDDFVLESGRFWLNAELNRNDELMVV